MLPVDIPYAAHSLFSVCISLVRRRMMDDDLGFVSMISPGSSQFISLLFIDRLINYSFFRIVFLQENLSFHF